MRILLLTQVVVYPADAGPKAKTLQVLRYLAARHEVIYCTFARSELEVQQAHMLRLMCSYIVAILMKRSWLSDMRFLLECLLHGDAFLLRRDECAEMHAAVRELIRTQRIELIYVDQLNMQRFVPTEWQGPVILDEHNAVWRVVERLSLSMRNPLIRGILRREVRLIRQLEGRACRNAQLVLTVSEHDRQALQAIAGISVPIEVVPIAVDEAQCACIRAVRKACSNKLLTIGTLFWPPNYEGLIWWLRDGYARLQRLCPDVTYDIVGARPPSTLQKLARRYTGVQLHGYVADATAFWQEASALVVPLLTGGGVRVKILEAMAMGVPVISTTIGCEGLAVLAGVHVLIADTPEALARACANVLYDQALRQHLVENAHQLIVERYDTKIVLCQLDDVIKRSLVGYENSITHGIGPA